MDGITLAASAHELSQELTGARVEKIYQPTRDNIFIAFRGGQRLLLSASADNCRAQLTGMTYSNPAEPPVFCMLLRKHIGKGHVVAVRQLGFDRVLNIDIGAVDELGDECVYTLVAEIMGKYSNIILLKQNGVVIDAVKRVTPGMSSVRTIIPGTQYIGPPAQDKKDPRTAGIADIGDALLTNPRIDKAIMGCFSGISPVMAREIAQRASDGQTQYAALDDSHRVLAIERIKAFFELLANNDYSPTLIVNDFGEAVACLPVRSALYEEKYQQPFDSMGRALDQYYKLRDTAERIAQKGRSLTHILQNNIERCCKKLDIQNEILAGQETLEQWRLYGELISANVYRLQKGASTAIVENYYLENAPHIEIPLDPRLSPTGNAQRYYKKYAKAKTAASLAAEQIEKSTRELQYLEGQLDNISKCTENNELAQIREELIALGYVKPEKGRKRAPKLAATKPMRFTASNGAEIYVGKNNAQNEALTLKFAGPDDMWLHTKNIPGSHVIIRGDAAEQTLLEAAALAAYYSKARNGEKVPVDYTPRRFVKKPSGTPPGFVTYSTNKTIYITPDEKLVKSLKGSE